MTSSTVQSSTFGDLTVNDGGIADAFAVGNDGVADIVDAFATSVFFGIVGVNVGTGCNFSEKRKDKLECPPF